MCGRLVQAKSVEKVRVVLEIDTALTLDARYNVAPSLPLAVLRSDSAGRYEWALPRWGLIPHWAKEPNTGYKMINAKAETVAAKPAYRGPFRHRRCVIPADGFYEWHLEGRAKQPYYIHAADDAPLLFAGLWDSWQGADPAIETCTIITTAANDTVAALHDRMPAILSPAAARIWLDPRTDSARLLPLLSDFKGALTFHKVSPRVNKASAEGPECIAPLAPT